MEPFFGEWKMLTMEGENDIQNAVGIPEEAKGKFNENKMKMTIEYGKDGDFYFTKLTLAPGIPAIEDHYQLGVEFDSKDLMGKPVKVTVNINDGKIVEKRVGSTYEAVQTRTLEGSILHTKTEIKEATMTTTMKRV